MMDSNIANSIDDLDDLLDEERTALLAGDIDRVGRLTERKQALIALLNDADPSDASSLSALQGKVVRNQGLLGAALDGIKAVTQRLAVMQRIKTSLDVYDARGTRKKIRMPAKGGVEKRA